MKWYGLTGGIASGKSTVAALLLERGVTLSDADAFARAVVAPGEAALEAIVETFGERVLREDGSLNREALGTIIFEDEGARKRLNGIVHPAIAARTAQWLQASREAGESFVVYDAALIVENGLQHMMDGLIVVALSSEKQCERLMSRESIDEASAAQRIESQFPLSKKLAVADWVIDNNGSLSETTLQVEALLAVLTAHANGTNTES